MAAFIAINCLLPPPLSNAISCSLIEKRPIAIVSHCGKCHCPKIEKSKIDKCFFLHRIPRDISINFTTQPALFSFLYALFACVPLSGHDRQQATTTTTDNNRQQQQQHCRSTTTTATFQCRLALKCRSFSGSSTFVADSRLDSPTRSLTNLQKICINRAQYKSKPNQQIYNKYKRQLFELLLTSFIAAIATDYATAFTLILEIYKSIDQTLICVIK